MGILGREEKFEKIYSIEWKMKGHQDRTLVGLLIGFSMHVDVFEFLSGN